MDGLAYERIAFLNAAQVFAPAFLEAGVEGKVADVDNELAHR